MRPIKLRLVSAVPDEERRLCPLAATFVIAGLAPMALVALPFVAVAAVIVGAVRRIREHGSTW